MKETTRYTLVARKLAVALMFAAVATSAAGMARATEIIPSFGMTKSTDTNGGNAQGFGGIALRAPVFPFLKAEGAIGYRQDNFQEGSIKVRQWPVTASAWLTPFPVVYAGGGVGWYRTTIDYPSNMPIVDRTTSKMGVHAGGGFDLPVAPQLSLDLNGRYIFMQKDKSTLEVPTVFNPDYWTTSLGLAIKF